MKKRIEEGTVPITKENIPQFLRSKLDKISQDFQSTFNNKTTSVKVSQTNIVTKVTFQFKGENDNRFDQLKKLYKVICNKDLLDEDKD